MDKVKTNLMTNVVGDARGENSQRYEREPAGDEGREGGATVFRTRADLGGVLFLTLFSNTFIVNAWLELQIHPVCLFCF